jgi:hypothetical protein
MEINFLKKGNALLAVMVLRWGSFQLVRLPDDLGLIRLRNDCQLLLNIS